MNKPIIEVKNISKKYTLGERQPYYSFRDTISGILRKPFRRESLEKDEFWALKDVSFDVNEGDVVGIIGGNGAGKSTLLKILSQITPPTEGQIKLNGRVASLLEVGTGFHAELTGRENIYLNGAILGMKRWEINNKFKQIIEFAETEKFLDTPVKHYSSGMYMRLAFAIAAHLEPEILIVDEVLAVGDVQFQKKCLGKMDEVSKKDGRTVLFVSHNMSAIKKLCTKGIFLKDGEKVLESNINAVIEKYTASPNIKRHFVPIRIPELNLIINRININEKENGEVYPNKPLQIDIEIESEQEIRNLGIQVMISHDDTEGRVFSTNTKATEGIDFIIKKGINRFSCLIKSFALCSGKYRLGFGIDIPLTKSYYFNTDLLYFDVIEIMFEKALLPTSSVYSHIYLNHEWRMEN